MGCWDCRGCGHGYGYGRGYGRGCGRGCGYDHVCDHGDANHAQTDHLPRFRVESV